VEGVCLLRNAAPALLDELIARREIDDLLDAIVEGCSKKKET